MSALGSTTRRMPGTGAPPAARVALAAAGLCTVALFGCWYLAFHSVTVARADAHAYFAFGLVGDDHARLNALAHWITGLCEPFPYVLFAGVAVGTALWRRRWTLALVLVVIIPAAPVSCDLLKPLMAGSRPAAGLPATLLSAESSWPSGHSAAAMVLALALVLASPARWRPRVALAGSAFTLAVVYSLLCLGWHYPSDALGGMLVALIWTLVGVAVVRWADARLGRDLSELAAAPRHWLDRLAPRPVLFAVAGGLIVVALVGCGPAAIGDVVHRTSFVAAALGLAAAAALAPTGLTLALSGRRVGAR